MKVLVTQSCPTLCDPMDYNPPDSSVEEILWARALEWIAMPCSRGSSRPRDQTLASLLHYSKDQCLKKKKKKNPEKYVYFIIESDPSSLSKRVIQYKIEFFLKDTRK